MSNDFKVSDIECLIRCPEFRQAMKIPKGYTAEQLTEQIDKRPELKHQITIWAAEKVLLSMSRHVKKKQNRILEMIPKFLLKRGN